MLYMVMKGRELREARLVSSWTQDVAAQELGVTQPYLSMVERGVRTVSSELASRALSVLSVPATVLPLGQYQPGSRSDVYFKKAFGGTWLPWLFLLKAFCEA